MKFFRIIGRSIRDALRSVGRNFSLSLASVVCITITLIIVGLSLIISKNVNTITKELESELEIVAFVSNDADDFDLRNIETQLKGLKNVARVSAKSKAEIKQEMMESNETFSSIMKNWDDTENPLQNVFLVRVDDVSQISETATAIKNIANITLVRYGEELVEQLLDIFEAIEKFSFYSVIALILVTVFLIINTIKLTIFSRKREISIMRLVGASNMSIKVPFVTEGVILGIIGAIIPIVMIIIGYTEFYEFLGGKLFTDIINLAKPEVIIYSTSLFILGIGIVVGMFGSLSAVKKYLKV